MSAERISYDDLIDMTDDERMALYGIATPKSWICAACWGDGWTTRWPCAPATAHGVELAKSLGLEWSD